MRRFSEKLFSKVLPLILLIHLTPAFAQDDPMDQTFSIEMVGAEIVDVVRLIGDQAGLNVIAGDGVTGTVTADFDGVTVRDALYAILKAHGYSFAIQGKIIIVKPADKKMIGELETLILKLNYINSDNLITPLKTVLSPDVGKIEPFTRIIARGGEAKSGLSNVVLITDVRENIPQIRKLIEELDVPIASINVSVKFIETNLDTTDNRGVDWSPSPITLGDATQSLAGEGIPLGWSNMTVATLNPKQLTDALNFLQGTGRSRLLSSPQITTLDNQQAKFETVTTVLIERLQFQQGSTGQSGVQPGGVGTTAITGLDEKDIGITLTVTPRVNDGNKITMIVKTTVEALLSSAEIDTDRPKTTKRTIDTQIPVNNGETAIIGGLISENLIESTAKVPILGDIPLIGFLFRSKTLKTEQRELLIFITPNIVG